MSFYDPEVDALIGNTPSVPVVLAPQQADLAMGAFDGADRVSAELLSWNPPLLSADGELLADKLELDGRAKDSMRNDAYVQNGADIQKDTVVGSAYLVNSKPVGSVLGLDEVWEQEFQQEVEAKFTLAAESPNNYFDAAGKLTFTELVRLCTGIFAYSGEYLASVEWIRDAGRPFRTAIQMIDVDRLCNPNYMVDTQFLRRGVEINRNGRPVAYHVLRSYPTDNVFDGSNMEWKRVPARKPWGRLQMIHKFDPWRPDQSRGFSQMVAALKEMRMTKKFRDIVLQSAVLQATYAATVESDLPSEAVFAALGAGQRSKGMNQWAASYMADVAKFSGKRHLQVNNVKVPHLWPGTKLNLQTAATPGGLGSTFEESMLRYISSALKVSYEQLSHDYSKVNYASARAGANETQKHMFVRKRICADHVASAMYRLWLEEMLNTGQIDSLPRNPPSWYEGLNMDAYANCEWIGAGRGQIDELKETQAAVLRIKNNLSTFEIEMGRLGLDWRKVMKQRSRENVRMKELELVMPEENMMNAASGSPRTPDDVDKDNQTEKDQDADE